MPPTRHASPTDPLLVYGSYGYTGQLIAARAVERGLRPTLAGRDGDAVREQAAELGVPHRVFGLDDPAAVDAGLAGMAVVLHCAGPFSRTSGPIADACLRTGTHYLDITGEIEVFEALAVRSAEAAAAGVMLLPGVGFDVVPSDCLAAHLHRRLPDATRLRLAIRGTGGISRGTATTMVENLHRGGAVRENGRIRRVPTAWKTREVDFGRGPRTAVTIPWGDVATAYHSTGIGNIEVYAAVPERVARLMRATRPLAPLLATAPLQRLLRWWVRRGEAGPDETARASGSSRVWGEVEDEQGNRAEARLRGPDGYTLTARTAVAAAERVLRGDAPAGFQTPSLAYGPDWILDFDGVVREDVA
ncbi:saccharopine dehydrogenase NADP-binding domain-containing protein [soil metagenome]